MTRLTLPISGPISGPPTVRYWVRYLNQVGFFTRTNYIKYTVSVYDIDTHIPTVFSFDLLNNQKVIDVG